MINKMNKGYDLVLIRHAQSLFNQSTYITADKLQLKNMGWNQFIKNKQFNKQVTYNNKYFDPLLSQKGKKQCENIKQECMKIKPDLILVSPYQRALQTCSLIFPKIQAPVIVQPVLAQVFRFACDIPNQLHLNQQRYPNFDFSKLQQLGNDWYLQNLVPELRAIIKQKIKDHKSHKQIQETLLQLLSRQQVHEDPLMLRQRTAQIKDLIKSYKQKYNKIVVVAHFYIIQFLKSVGFDNSNELVKYHDVLNCHPYYQIFEELDKVR